MHTFSIFQKYSYFILSIQVICPRWLAFVTVCVWRNLLQMHLTSLQQKSVHEWSNAAHCLLACCFCANKISTLQKSVFSNKCLKNNAHTLITKWQSQQWDVIPPLFSLSPKLKYAALNIQEHTPCSCLLSSHLRSSSLLSSRLLPSFLWMSLIVGSHPEASLL